MSKHCLVCESLKDKVKDLETVLGMYHERLNELVNACENKINGNTSIAEDYTAIGEACDHAKALMPKS